MVTVCSRLSDNPCPVPHGNTSYVKCIDKHGDSIKPACLLSNELFSTRPKLGVIAVPQFWRPMQENTSSSEQRGAQTGEVLCDVCTGKALKSCQVCLSSFCKTHLEPHVKFPGLRRHELTSPVKNLEEKMQKKYEKATRRLEMFKGYFTKLMRFVGSS